MRKSVKSMLLACAVTAALAMPVSANDGKTITVALDTGVITMDSSLANTLDNIHVVGNVQEGLYAMGSENVPVPALATGMEISEDGLTYTFTIRDDAVWSNGTPVTANDFVCMPGEDWRILIRPVRMSG